MAVAATRAEALPEIVPLSPVMGAEVRGVDLSRPLSMAAFTTIVDAFYRHLVLVFRDQVLPKDAQLAFTRRFGPTNIFALNQFLDDQYAGLILLSNVGADGRPIGRHPDKGNLIWHCDAAYQLRPALATFLYGVEIPAQGGDTEYSNTCLAYEALPAATKARIATLRAVHDLEDGRRKVGEQATADQAQRFPPVAHPLVRTHLVTGRKALFFTEVISEIVGLPKSEGDALFRELLAHIQRPEFTWRHRWRQGDLVVWDNRCTLHRATPYDYGQARRVMHRTVTTGEIPF